MKKLLMTASSFAHIESFHLPYLAGFKALGWELHLACGGEARAIPDAAAVLPLPFEKSFTAPGNFRACAMLRRQMRRERYDLVIAHTSLAAFFTRLAAAGLRPRPRVINVMHGYLFDDETPFLRAAVLKAAELLTAPWTDLVLTMNEYDTRWARAHRAGKQIRQIPGMGVDAEKLLASPAREIPGAAEGDFVLVYPAEFSKRKNQTMLIRAMALLPERVKLLLPGEGALLEECRRLARELGLEKRVLFPGYVREIGALLARADAAVTASRSEGLPFNVIEAMLMGLPVAASRVKGHTDLVTDGETGLLFPFGDEAAFAGAIQKLLDDGALRARLGARGREAAQAYRLEAVFPQVMDAYCSLI